MHIESLLKQVQTVSASRDGGKTWGPVRGKSAENTFLRHRIRMALLVLRGKADAITWGD